MPLDKCNLITVKAMGLIFSLFDVAPERCLLANHSTYNAFFINLTVPSFVSYSAWLTAKGVNLAVACDGFPS